MKIICAWCGSLEGEKELYNKYDITHTICENCYFLLLKHFEEKTVEDEVNFLKMKIKHINKWIEKAFYEKTSSEKNDALFHVLKQLVCVNKCLGNLYKKITDDNCQNT